MSTFTASHKPNHHGAVVIITNADRSRFVVQEKDEGYEAHPNGLCLFGGSLDPGESPREAMERELTEETDETVWPVLVDTLRELWTTDVVCGDISYRLTVYDSVVSDSEISRIAAAPVKEGRSAQEVNEAQLPTIDWVWGLEAIAKRYLEEKGWGTYMRRERTLRASRGYKLFDRSALAAWCLVIGLGFTTAVYGWWVQ